MLQHRRVAVRVTATRKVPTIAPATRRLDNANADPELPANAATRVCPISMDSAETVANIATAMLSARRAYSATPMDNVL